jgi:hypothetical protein
MGLGRCEWYFSDAIITKGSSGDRSDHVTVGAEKCTLATLLGSIGSGDCGSCAFSVSSSCEHKCDRCAGALFHPVHSLITGCKAIVPLSSSNSDSTLLTVLDISPCPLIVGLTFLSAVKVASLEDKASKNFIGPGTNTLKLISAS